METRNKRDRSRERPRSDATMDNGRGNARSAVREAYNAACVAVDEYNYHYPGTNLQLEALNLADNDPHNENDIQIPIEFTRCRNLTHMGRDLSEYSHTDCYIGYETVIDRGEVVPQHSLHIDPRGLARVSSGDSTLLTTLVSLPRVVRWALLVLLFFGFYKMLP